MSDSSSSELLTARDCMRLGRFPRSTFYDHLRRGTGPQYLKIGQQIRVRRCDWEAWLKAHEIRPGQRAA